MKDNLRFAKTTDRRTVDDLLTEWSDPPDLLDEGGWDNLWVSYYSGKTPHPKTKNMFQGTASDIPPKYRALMAKEGDGDETKTTAAKPTEKPAAKPTAKPTAASPEDLLRKYGADPDQDVSYDDVEDMPDNLDAKQALLDRFNKNQRTTVKDLAALGDDAMKHVFGGGQAAEKPAEKPAASTLPPPKKVRINSREEVTPNPKYWEATAKETQQKYAKAEQTLKDPNASRDDRDAAEELLDTPFEKKVQHDYAEDHQFVKNIAAEYEPESAYDTEQLQRWIDATGELPEHMREAEKAGKLHDAFKKMKPAGSGDQQTAAKPSPEDLLRKYKADPDQDVSYDDVEDMPDNLDAKQSLLDRFNKNQRTTVKDLAALGDDAMRHVFGGGQAAEKPAAPAKPTRTRAPKKIVLKGESGRSRSLNVHPKAWKWAAGEAQKNKDWADRATADPEWMRNASDSSRQAAEKYKAASAEDLAKDTYLYTRMRASQATASGEPTDPDANANWQKLTGEAIHQQGKRHKY
jgi:hypothetical protein